MRFEDAERIFRDLQAGTQGHTTLDQLYADLIAAAVRYARIRVDWKLSDVDTRRELEDTRTAAHEALIDACNILSRNMAKHGKDIRWRAALGENRKEIGDFACYVHCVLGLSAR